LGLAFPPFVEDGGKCFVCDDFFILVLNVGPGDSGGPVVGRVLSADGFGVFAEFVRGRDARAVGGQCG
jgi:hypothetical protein